jgi:hypothetical protein
MDTRKLLEDGLNGHKNSKTLQDLYGSETEWEQVLNHFEDEAAKGNSLACEWMCLDQIQYCYIHSCCGEEILDLLDALKVENDIALRNGSKYAGFLKYLEGKHSNDQNLIDQYAQYASVEEEFAYCKKTAMQPTPSESSPVQPAPTPISSTPYHLGLGKERLGEHTLEQIKQKIEQGTFDPLTKAWQQGWPEWKVVSDVPEIASIMASQPPPLPDDGPPPL